MDDNREYEYKVGLYHEESLEVAANELAEDGWRLISTQATGDGSYIHLFFERPHRLQRALLG